LEKDVTLVKELLVVTEAITISEVPYLGVEATPFMLMAIWLPASRVIFPVAGADE